MENSAESPKYFFKKVLNRGPYYEILQFLEANPNLYISGSVGEGQGRYVHYNSTNISLNVEGFLGDEEVYPHPQDAALEKSVNELEKALKEQVIDWNRQLEKELYAELERMQSDEELTSFMREVEWKFTDDGERVDMDDYMPIDNLKPGIREKVLRDYADLMERTPEQAYASIKARDYRFDHRGNRVDVSQFLDVTALDDAVRREVFDKYRDILVGDNTWAEPLEEDWTTKLEDFGFGRVEIRYSLGYSQGDGASFTADTIDVKKLCTEMLKQQVKEAAAAQLVGSLLE